MENDFEKKMENLETPETGFVKHQEVLKIGLVNAKKSARIGILFILLPIILVALAYVKIVVLMQLDFFSNFQKFVMLDSLHSYKIWLIHIAFIGLPILAIIINLIAVTHFYIDKKNKELIISIQYKLRNLIVLIIGACFIIAVLMYILLMN